MSWVVRCVCNVHSCPYTANRIWRVRSAGKLLLLFFYNVLYSHVIMNLFCGCDLCARWLNPAHYSQNGAPQIIHQPLRPYKTAHPNEPSCHLSVHRVQISRCGMVAAVLYAVRNDSLYLSLPAFGSSTKTSPCPAGRFRRSTKQSNTTMMRFGDR